MPAYCPEGDPEFMPTPEQDRIARLHELEDIVLGHRDLPEGVTFADIAREVKELRAQAESN